MSRTSSDAVQLLYDYLKASALFAGSDKPNGALYKYKRPDNSELEDVVINSLSLNRTEVQRGILNVNIYVPNHDFAYSDKPKGDNQPDTQRAKELSNLFNLTVGGGSDIWPTGDYNFAIERDNFFQDTNNQHYINFRIEFYSSKNI